MEKYANIINNRIDQLIQITIKDRTENGLGMLFLDFTEKLELNCKYIPLQSDLFPDELRKSYGDRMRDVPNSIIFFFIFDNENNQILEIDLDKNSKFHDQNISKKNKLTEWKESNNESKEFDNESNNESKKSNNESKKYM